MKHYTFAKNNVQIGSVNLIVKASPMGRYFILANVIPTLKPFKIPDSHKNDEIFNIDTNHTLTKNY